LPSTPPKSAPRSPFRPARTRESTFRETKKVFTVEILPAWSRRLGEISKADVALVERCAKWTANWCVEQDLVARLASGQRAARQRPKRLTSGFLSDAAGFPDAWRLWRPHQAFGIDRRAAKRSFWHGLAGNRLRGEDLDVTPRSLNRFNRSIDIEKSRLPSYRIISDPSVTMESERRRIGEFLSLGAGVSLFDRDLRVIHSTRLANYIHLW
jgi:hypothetical protein